MTWQLAIIPTDTVWGLVAKLNPENLERIYQIKGRDKSKPLILFGSNLSQFQAVSESWDPYLERVLAKCWPGSFTLVLPRSKSLPDWINPGVSTIGMRIPDSQLVQELLCEVPGNLLLSTSANLSGQAPVANYQEAMDQFSESVDLILDSEQEPSQVASTVAEYSSGKFKVLRQGDLLLSNLA